jgi:hypothetical protein
VYFRVFRGSKFGAVELYGRTVIKRPAVVYPVWQAIDGKTAQAPFGHRQLLKADASRFVYFCVWICHSFHLPVVLNQASLAN